MTETMQGTPDPNDGAGDSLFEQAMKKNEKLAADSKLDVLGALTWWTLAGIEITLPDFQALLTQHGFDPKIAPIPEARGALKDAADSLGLSFRLGRHKVDAERFAISFDQAALHQNGGTTVEVDYKVEQVVEYNYTSKQLTFKNTFMELEIRAAFTRYLTTLQANDVRQAIMRALDTANAITVRERGGVYFVPAQKLEVVQRLKALCQAISNRPGSGSAAFTVYLVANLEENRQEAIRDASADVEAELLAAEKDLGEIEAKKKAGEKVRGDTLTRRITDFAKIREKATAYAELLGFKQESVIERISRLQETVMELV